MSLSVSINKRDMSSKKDKSSMKITMTPYLVYGLSDEDRHALCVASNEQVVTGARQTPDDMMGRIHKIVKESRIARGELEKPFLYAVKCLSAKTKVHSSADIE